VLQTQGGMGMALALMERVALERYGRFIAKYFYGLPTLELNSLLSRDVEIEPPVLDDICLPPYFGPTTHDDFIPLMKIARSQQPRVVLELGTAHGNTVANICRQCPNARVYTVNAPAEEQTGTLVTYELRREEIGRVYRDQGFGGRVEQIFKNTLDLDLSEYFRQPIVDLAIIDACHDIDYVINDFIKVRPFISPRGRVLLHDTHPSMEEHLAGSYTACMLLRQKGYDLQHIKNTWWAIWENTGR
jgi:hypothetical protein